VVPKLLLVWVLVVGICYQAISGLSNGDVLDVIFLLKVLLWYSIPSSPSIVLWVKTLNPLDWTELRFWM
jgi:hypothetical protein